MNSTLIATTIKTTVQISCTEASVIRCFARKDMPEYGLTEGQTFYCARSKSEAPGTYHIVVWNFERIAWDCPCKATTPWCHHNKAIVADCSKEHSLQGYKPMSKAQKFAALLVEHDARYQTEKLVRQESTRRGAVSELVYQIETCEAERAACAMQLNRKAAPTFELAPSGRLVPMR